MQRTDKLYSGSESRDATESTRNPLYRLDAYEQLHLHSHDEIKSKHQVSECTQQPSTNRAGVSNRPNAMYQAVWEARL